ncbi:MAG: hypothetical protein AAGB12_07415 [Pseudomonadota bacterium]
MKNILYFFWYFLLFFCSSIAAKNIHYEHCQKGDVQSLREVAEAINRNFSAQIAKLDHNELTSDDRGKHYNLLFEKCIVNNFSLNDLKKLHVEQLQQIFSLIDSVIFYAKNPAVIPMYTKVLNEKKTRGEDIDHAIINLFRNYTLLRLDKEALALKSAYPTLLKEKSVTTIKRSKSPGKKLLYFPENQDILIEKAFQLPQGKHIVVINSLKCNGSKNFIQWVSAKPEMLAFFKNHSTWIMHQSRNLDVQALKDFNKTHPEIYSYHINSESDWPEIPFWGTPTFYLFDKGKMIKQLIGWPPEGKEQQLQELIAYFNPHQK